MDRRRWDRAWVAHVLQLLHSSWQNQRLKQAASQLVALPYRRQPARQRLTLAASLPLDCRCRCMPVGS